MNLENSTQNTKLPVHSDGSSEALDKLRLNINKKLNPVNKSNLGQFMTPSVIANFMANLFDKGTHQVRLLDCGAGIGSLSLSALKVLKNIDLIDLWEIDPIMQKQLHANMQSTNAPYVIHSEDFISGAVERLVSNSGARYTHAIINPPYKKISSTSEHRKQLRVVGIETVNLYSAFLALTILLLEENGQAIAIIPRSFCNGPYYRPFRDLILKECSIDHIHVFESRNKAFQDDDVLQENIIIKLTKSKQAKTVAISHSSDHNFSDYQCRAASFNEVVKPNDSESFFHIPTEEGSTLADSPIFKNSLSDIGLSVSTGPVVSHRLSEFLQQELIDGSVPLLYPHHFVNKKLQHPKPHKKPNAINISPESKKWLMPNNGYYVLVRRFSAKEEKRRVVAYIVNPVSFSEEWIGFDNCWNVFHTKKSGIDRLTASGLACFLNSSLLDEHFRVFSGHTQVNATDLKNMKYPSLSDLQRLGEAYADDLSQSQIDELMKAI